MDPICPIKKLLLADASSELFYVGAPGAKETCVFMHWKEGVERIPEGEEDLDRIYLQVCQGRFNEQLVNANDKLDDNLKKSTLSAHSVSVISSSALSLDVILTS